jgi:hypothetical protein
MDARLSLIEDTGKIPAQFKIPNLSSGIKSSWNLPKRFDFLGLRIIFLVLNLNIQLHTG